MRSRLLVFLSAVLLSACQTDTSRYPDSSPFKPVPVGSILELHQPITIPADKLAVYLQGGKVRPFSEVDVTRAHCKFQLYRLSDRERTVHPDRFRITKVQHEETHSVSWPGIQYAAGRVGIGINVRIGSSGGDSDSPSVRAFVTQMRLQSANQPEVFRLSCGHVDDPGSHFLSIEQIRKTLGEVFTLRTGEIGK